MIKMTMPPVKIPPIKVTGYDGAVPPRLLELFLFAIQFIRDQRTVDGIGQEGQPLLDGGTDRYNPAYEALKIKHGRSPYHPEDRFVGIGDVLQAEGRKPTRLGIGGHMMKAQHIDTSDPIKGTLHFSPEAAEKAWYNHVMRPWLGLRKKESDEAWDNALIQYKREKGRDA